MRKTSLSKQMAQRKREEELVKFFLSHVPENKRNKDLIQIALDRIKSPKIAPITYSDEYSREWFKTLYHLGKNLRLNKLNISWE